MEYYNNKIITLLDNTPNQPSKSRTKNGVEIKDVSRYMRRLTQIVTSIVKLSWRLQYYRQVYVIIVMYMYILVKGPKTTTENARPPAGGAVTQIQTTRENDERNKGIVFKNCPPFTDSINETKNTQIDIDVVMPMYNLIE